MTYYLAKTEPSTYSIDQLAKDKQTTWDGVSNPTAVQFLKKMQPGDKVLIYHSGEQRAIVGLAEVVGESKPDPKNPRSWLVHFKYLRTYEESVTLKEIKETGKFEDFRLVYQGRLSTMDVPEDFVTWLKKEKKLEI